MVALGIVLLVGTFLVSLGAMALLAPAHASRFLLGFAGSARLHYIELALRAVSGVVFVLHAPQMRFAEFFGVFGWILLATTAGLAVMPWRWHRAFTERTVPYATRYMPLIGLASLAFGVFILASALTGTRGLS